MDIYPRRQSHLRAAVRLIKKHNVELQFWGYELGNVLAAVAGIGGIAAMLHALTTSNSASNTAFVLFKQQPDLAVTLGMGFIVLISPLLRNLIARIGNSFAPVLFDYCVAGLALLLFLLAIYTNTSWITVAGSSFVVASALLRYALDNAVFLKLGGMLLQAGGFALSMFGATLILESMAPLDTLLGSFTVATGFYVCGAGMLTYLGGIYETRAFLKNDKVHRNESLGSFQTILNPVSGTIPRLLTKYFDKSYLWLCQYVVNRTIFWVSQKTKDTKPFLTSMAARLPWRILSGVTALATLSDAGAVFALANFLWAIGDIAIGSIDWEVNKNADEKEHKKLAEDPQILFTAALILPGTQYSDNSKSVLVTKFDLTIEEFQQLVAKRNAKSRVCFLQKDQDAESQLAEILDQ